VALADLIEAGVEAAFAFMRGLVEECALAVRAGDEAAEGDSDEAHADAAEHEVFESVERGFVEEVVHVGWFGEAARCGGGFEIGVAEFDGDCAGEQFFITESPGGSFGERVEYGVDFVAVDGVACECVLVRDGFGESALGNDGGVIYALCAFPEETTPGAECAFEHAGGKRGDVTERDEVEFAERVGCRGADAGEFFHLEMTKEGSFVAGVYAEDAVGFGES